MNARDTAPVFELHFLSEEVPTVMFGTVTVVELPARQLQQLYALMPDDDSNPEEGKRFAYSLLCEAARGEHGECFTLELLERLPNRGLGDVALLVKTAVRLNGLNRAEVEKV
jgi:hypothetical protein